jgi:hypothetical protein
MYGASIIALFSHSILFLLLTADFTQHPWCWGSLICICSTIKDRFNHIHSHPSRTIFRHMFDARPWKTTTDGISPVGDSNLEYIYPLISAREPDLVLGSRFIYIVLYICKGNYQKLSICILYIWIILWENSGQNHHYLSLEHIEPQNNMICPHKHSYEWVHFKETNVLWIKIDPQLDMSKDDPGFSYLTVKKCPQRSRYTHPYNYIPYTFYTLRLLLVATTHSIPHSIMW